MASLRALESLVAIAEAGSLTRAAATLHLSQPALSHQIHVLEQEVGAPVLDRLPRGVRLTAAGVAMLDSARAGTLAAARAVALGRAAAQGRVGVLRVACAESMTAGLLAHSFAAWRRAGHDVGIELTERSSADLLARDVVDGTTDLAIGPRPSGRTLEVRLIGREEVLLVCAPDHPFAGRSGVRLAEIVEHPFVHLHRSNGLAAWIDVVAAGAGVVLAPAIRVRSASSAARLAAAGLGVTLAPRSALTVGADGAIVPLDPPLLREVVAMHRAPIQPVVDAFCSVVHDTAPLVGPRPTPR